MTELLAREAPSMRVTWTAEQLSQAAYAEWARGAVRKVLLFDACSASLETLNLLGRLRDSALNLPVVALLLKDDPELALRCLRTGACGCLLRPFDAEQLRPVLLRVGYELPASGPGENGRVLCVLPAKGSCGATTLAANLACQSGRAGFKRVLLADMDPLAGTLAFVLKFKSNYSFADALAHAGQLDADLWRGLVTPYRGFDVLLSPENPLDTDAAAGEIHSLLSYARRTYDLVILDSGGAYGSLGAELARLSDDVLFVTTSQLASAYAAKRALSHLAANEVSKARMRLVLSCCRRGLGFDREEIEAALDMTVFHALPYDPQAVEDALLEGRPVTPGSPFGRSLAELTALLLERDRTREKTSPLKGLYSLFGRR